MRERAFTQAKRVPPPAAELRSKISLNPNAAVVAAVVAIILSASASIYSCTAIRAIRQEQRDLALRLGKLNIAVQQASARSDTDSAQRRFVPAIDHDSPQKR